MKRECDGWATWCTSLCVRPTVHYIERDVQWFGLLRLHKTFFFPFNCMGDALVVTVQQLQSQDPKIKSDWERQMGRLRWSEDTHHQPMPAYTTVYRPEIYNENLAGDAIICWFIQQKKAHGCENEQMLHPTIPAKKFPLSLSLLFWNGNHGTKKTCALLQKGSNASCP